MNYALLWSHHVLQKNACNWKNIWMLTLNLRCQDWCDYIIQSMNYASVPRRTKKLPASLVTSVDRRRRSSKRCLPVSSFLHCPPADMVTLVQICTRTLSGIVTTPLVIRAVEFIALSGRSHLGEFCVVGQFCRSANGRLEQSARGQVWRQRGREAIGGCRRKLQLQSLIDCLLHDRCHTAVGDMRFLEREGGPVHDDDEPVSCEFSSKTWVCE